jgi:soluble lytic murein transglycosylase
MVLIFSVLACNTERVLDPSLPTYTAPPPTLPPGIIPTETPTPSPIPVPTVDPGIRIETGDKALFNGDWQTAINEYQLILDTINDPQYQSAALLGLGRTRYYQREYSSALTHLRTLIDTYPQSPKTAYAYFTLGEVYMSLERYAEAFEAYQQYANRHPGLIDTYVYERIGDALVGTRDYQGAIANYESALSSEHIGDRLEVNAKIGDAYTLMGDHNSAIVAYNYVFDHATNDYLKAQMDLLRGRAHLALGLTEQGYGFYLHAVEHYPLSYDSYTALLDLVNAGVPVSDLYRGIVDYFVGQYGYAVAAFDRYILAYPDDPNDTPYYFKALALRALDDPLSALATFDELLANRAYGDHWIDAIDQKAFTLWYYLDQHDAAIQTYLDFVDNNPTHTSAPAFLFDAGRIAEYDGDINLAAQIWERLGTNYPASGYGFDGFFMAGISHYRQGTYPQAIMDFQGALGLSKNPEQQAQSYFWIGKSHQKSNNANESIAAFQQAAALDPTGYYSERANDLLAGRHPFTPPNKYSLSYDIETERAEAESWIINYFGLPPETNLGDLSPLLSDSRVIRGSELWELGLFEDARLEFENFRISVQNDPASTYRLANFLIDLGLYRSGIIAARQVLNLAGMSDAATMYAPTYFSHLRFGTYYWDLIVPISQSYGIHPLLIFSIVRQESLFEGFVTSTAGARGLMQIIPTTGQGVVNKLAWPPNYTPDDLYLPNVSIKLGTDYLFSQLKYFDGDIYAALAAYNGGPGNAGLWIELAQEDQDLFAEVIRFSETRAYIRSIYEIFTIYRNLYTVP